MAPSYGTMPSLSTVAGPSNGTNDRRDHRGSFSSSPLSKPTGDTLQVPVSPQPYSILSTISEIPLSPLQMFTLNIALAGLQFAWSVELGYGSPYLLALGLPKPLMSLVWLAGPLSGFVIHPLIGAISDRHTSKLGRRRPFILIGSLLVVISIAVIAFAKEIAVWWVFRVRGGDYADPEVVKRVGTWAIILAVVSFYVLDFSINAVQACLRALVLDVAPLSQQDSANAYAGRMLMLGSTLGYFMGFINLVDTFPYLGHTQMQVLCVLANIVFTAGVAVTCLSVHEKVITEEDLPEEERNRSAWSTLTTIFHAFFSLPKPLQQVCNVQFFSWMGWFPVLFYSTTWVVEVIARHYPGKNPISDPEFFDRATRIGSFALFLWSITSFVASIVLPWFAREDDDDLCETHLIRCELGDASEPFWPTSPVQRLLAWLPHISMRRMYTFSHVFFAAVMFSTYFVQDHIAATVVVMLTGIPWALTLWIPFALVGEFVSKMTLEAQSLASSAGSPQFFPAGSESIDQVLSLPNVASSYQRASPHAVPIHMRSASDIGDGPQSAMVGSTLSGTLPTSLSLPPTANVPSLVIEGDHGLAKAMPDLDENSDAASHSTTDDGGLPVPEDARLLQSPVSQATYQTRSSQRPALDSGIVLGIHNMYVVFPQFFMTILSSVVFSLLQDSRMDTPHDQAHGAAVQASSPWPFAQAIPVTLSTLNTPNAAAGPDAVGWVLRIGGACALVAAILSLKIMDMRRIRASDWL
ncbi:hypothetical protein H4R35_003773 [Dimargaris xerosporica]|nr:hypothetical protein H4R35_003773 [Dimargaris xerosporica]